MYAKVLRNRVLSVQITMGPIFRCCPFLARKHNFVHLRHEKHQMKNLKKKENIGRKSGCESDMDSKIYM